MVYEELEHIFYDSPIPQEIESKLADLYQNVFSVKEYFTVFKKIYQFNAVLIKHNNTGVIKHIICYAVNKNRIVILNELIEIKQEMINYICEIFFKRYPQITIIKMNRIKSSIYSITHPFKIWSITKDVVVELPATVGEYYSKLSKRTRQNLNYYPNRLNKTFNDFTFNITTCNDITPELIARIIEMNRSRMKSKRIKSAADKSYEETIIKLAAAYGLVGTIQLDGQVVAGIICFNMGNTSCYGELISHDNRYSKYDVGQLCMYLTIKHLIESGTEYFHMMEGNNHYKYRYLGVDHNQLTFDVYKNNIIKMYYFPAVISHLFGIVPKYVSHYYAKAVSIMAKKWKTWMSGDSDNSARPAEC